MSYTLIKREHDSVWLHDAEPKWIVHYPATMASAEHWQRYRAIGAVPPGKMPWKVNNRRERVLGFETGFATLADAMEAA